MNPAAAIFESGVNALGSIASTAIHNRSQRKLAEYSFEQQQAMIDRQNQYNLPVNQMQRYQAAGLNPNLVYGQISPGNQQQIAKYDAPNLSRYDARLNFVDTIMNYMLKREELKQQKYQSDIQESEATIKRNEALFSNFISDGGLNSLRVNRYSSEAQKFHIINQLYNMQLDESMYIKSKRYPHIQSQLLENLEREFERNKKYPHIQSKILDNLRQNHLRKLGYPDIQRYIFQNRLDTQDLLMKDYERSKKYPSIRSRVLDNLYKEKMIEWFNANQFTKLLFPLIKSFF